ncbi:MAG TPA: helicase C-terminal domain-containing protein [Chloroflexota bacterium]|nr:helicase C-terminal domain-containing protein [Chloroflexota bacterium]
MIRSTSDRGAVVILDSRLWTKRYGETLLRSLPDARVQRCDWRELGSLVGGWLRGPRP